MMTEGAPPDQVYTGPNGSRLEEYTGDELVYVMSGPKEHYGMGMNREDFDAIAGEWVRLRTEPDPSPPEVRTHASNARHGERLHARADDTHERVKELATTRMQLAVLTVEELRELWNTARALMGAVEIEGKSREKG